MGKYCYGGEVTLVATYRLAHNLSFIDVAPPIPGFEKFISVYVLETGKMALVDIGPSSSVENLISGLKELKLDPADINYVLATHIHIDHAGGIGKAMKYLPNARLVVHERGAPHMADPTRLWEDSQRALGQRALEYQQIEAVPEDRIIIVKDDMVLDLEGMEMEILETPGHAAHHVSYFNRKEQRLFVGEAVSNYFEDIDFIRLSTPSPFNLEQTLTSWDRLVSLSPSSMCYGHFGCTTQVLDKLHEFKRKLLLWGSIIADCVEKDASYEDMHREIQEQDDTLAKLDGLPPKQRDREVYFINNSIMGMASYFKRYGSEYLRKVTESS